MYSDGNDTLNLRFTSCIYPNLLLTFNILKAAFFLKSKIKRVQCSLPHAKIQFFNFEIAVYGFMATSFQRTVPELLLRRYKVVETFHAAEQEQRAEKFEIGKLGNTSTATNAVSCIRRYVKYELSNADTRYFQK